MQGTLGSGTDFRMSIGQLQALLTGDMSGDCTQVSGGAITCTATNGVAFGPFATGTNAASLTGSIACARLPAFTGDITTSACAATLATVNGNVGSFTNANITVNAKGLITAASNGTGGGGSPGGSSGQVQYNNAGAFGGFTMSGDCVIVPSTGVLTCSPLLHASNNLSDVSSAPAALTNLGAQGLLYPAAKSGNWYMPPFTNVVAGTTMTASRMICQEQINILSSLTVKTLGARITTLGASNIQLAVYADSSGRPNGAPLGATGNIADTGTGLVSATPAGGAFPLPLGPYWDCEVANDSTVVLQSNAPAVAMASAYTGSATQANVNSASTGQGLSVFQAITFGSWPTVTSTGWTEAATQAQGGIVMLQAN